MGKRYQAILKHLDKKFTCADLHTKFEQTIEMAKTSQGVIIASPTPSHFNYLDSFSTLKIPVLCEKPLSKSYEELVTIKEELVKVRKMNLTMTMQYKMLDHKDTTGLSFYDYFRHGNDGLAWDCLQILGLARGPVQLKEDSPVWRCILNGRVLSLSDMDKAYVGFVRQWLTSPGDKIEELFEIHLKVMEYIDGKKH